MSETRNADFSYRGHSFHFELLRRCTVSQHLETNETFYELPFLEAVGSTLPSETVAFDVGAHIGNHTVYFAKVLGWRVVAFEPNPEAFDKLISNVEANDVGERVTCFEVALSNRPGTVTLARSSLADAGTFRVTEEAGDAEDLIEAEAVTLDDYEQLAGGESTLLKLDVEGHERSVIEGGGGFLDRLAPYVTTEVQSESDFDELLGVLGESFNPSGVFNPTPTIMWVPKTREESLSGNIGLIRYAIRAQIAYNNAHRELKARNSLDVLESVLDDENADQPSESDRTDLVRLRDQLAATVETKSLATKRLLAVVVGENRVPAAALSAVAKAVDVVEVGNTEARTIRMRRYVGGHVDKELVTTSPEGGDHLAAAQVSLFVDSGKPAYGRVDAAAVIGGEGAPDLADVVVDLLDVPYINVALDPVFLTRRLRQIVGASACFVASHQQLDDWHKRQIMPARVLDPTDPMSMIGGIFRALPQTDPQKKAREETDRRLLLVSYYSPPANTVATQRLAYWMGNLRSIATEMGISLSVDWLNATSPSGSREGFLYVADRGPFNLPPAEWARVKELQDLGLDVIGATWSHYVRAYLGAAETTYDTVLISGNPFFYFDLAQFFRERWDSRVILDFRDPWAREVRINYTIEQRAKLLKLEEELVGHADVVVSVNQECLDAIAPSVDVPRYVVANGYDETTVDAVTRPDHEATRRTGRIRLAYAGTIYAGLPLDDLLDSLAADRYELIHFGRDYSRSQAAKTHPVARTAGLVSYEGLISGLKSSDAGIVMTTGEPTMSTAKLFDYVACDLDIIIITKGMLRTGLLQDLTSDLDGIYWVEDDHDELKRFFHSYRPQRRQREERFRFSRREQAKRLVELAYGEHRGMDRERGQE